MGKKLPFLLIFGEFMKNRDFLFEIVVVFEIIAFEILNLLQALRCNTQTFLNFLRKNRFLHQSFKFS
jgi:hypothetical protein